MNPVGLPARARVHPLPTEVSQPAPGGSIFQDMRLIPTCRARSPFPFRKYAFYMFMVLLSALLPTSTFADTFVRINQLGYKPADPKVAVVMSDQPVQIPRFQLRDRSGDVVFEGELSEDQGAWLAFDHHYLADFSAYRHPGGYRLIAGNAESHPFPISTLVYEGLPDSLLAFFHVQRCGDAEARYHGPCHLQDACCVVKPDGRRVNKAHDVTGGWHDAGDYTKFVLTASHAVYFMLLTRHYMPGAFGDHNGNGINDLLDEAHIGLDWLMKMHPSKDRLFAQVQDKTDHGVGWRLPENDTLADERPVFELPSRAIAGSSVAAMALGAMVLRDEDPAYADRLLQHAERLWHLAIGQTLPKASIGPDSMYFDAEDADNLALAAVELYHATGAEDYHDEAVKRLDALEPAYWPSWGDVTGLAHARFSAIHKPSREKTEQSLAYFAEIAEGNPFGYPLTVFPWGSTSVQLTIAALGILLSEEVETIQEVPPVVYRQRDFVLGENPHGVVFIGGFGEEHVRYPHHQIAHLTGQPLPGVLVAGYASRDQFEALGIAMAGEDRFATFQTEKVVYYDNRNDYLTNEPTVAGNAIALFVYTWFSLH
ncbi:hypothetical protein GF324_07265 [bacterium]|nr:hypothetical protein [bacterium]